MTLQPNKAHLIQKGFIHEYDMDYEENFAFVDRLTTCFQEYFYENIQRKWLLVKLRFKKKNEFKNVWKKIKRKGKSAIALAVSFSKHTHRAKLQLDISKYFLNISLIHF